MPNAPRFRTIAALLALALFAPAMTGGAGATPAKLGPRDALVYYFAKINQRQFHAAFLVWERDEAGRNVAGQSEAQFKAGFAQTRRVAAKVGLAGEAEGAAGSIYVAVDVTINATLRSGRRQLFKGTYTMRRNTVEGGHADWRIQQARMVRIQ